jgi:hypothetical protein
MGLLVAPDKMGEMVAKEGKESLLNWTGQDSVRQERVLEVTEGEVEMQVRAETEDMEGME